MDALRVAGNPDEAELAALVALLMRDDVPERPDPTQQWRDRRRAALRRTAQQTR